MFFGVGLFMVKFVLFILNVVLCMFFKCFNCFVVLVEVNGEIRKVLVMNIGRLEEFMIFGRKVFCVLKEGGKIDFVLVVFEDEEGKGVVIDIRM